MTRLDQDALDAAADAMSEASYEANSGRDAAQRVITAYLAALPVSRPVGFGYMPREFDPPFRHRLVDMEELWERLASGIQTDGAPITAAAVVAAIEDISPTAADPQAASSVPNGALEVLVEAADRRARVLLDEASNYERLQMPQVAAETMALRRPLAETVKAAKRLLGGESAEWPS